MLPLIPNMPVAMTDHIDRSVDNIIMRGRVGHMNSWILHEKENSVFEDGIRALHYLPKVVFPKWVFKLAKIKKLEVETFRSK